MSDPSRSEKILVSQLLQDNRLAEAELHCARLIEMYPEDAEIWSMRGTAKARLGLINEAQQCFLKAVALDSANPTNHFLLGRVLEYQGRYEEAKGHYEDALRRRPAYAEAHMHLANTLAVQGLPDEAVEHYERAIALDPALTEAYVNLGGLQLRQGRLDAAETNLRTAVTLNKDLPEAYHHLGDLSWRLNKADAAIEYYNKALLLKPTLAEAVNNLGSVLFDQYEIEQAIDCFRKALHLKPALIEAHYNLAVARLEQGLVDEAIQSSKEAIRLNPNYVDAYNNLGRIYKGLGRMEEALSCYQTAVRLAPNNTKAITGLASMYEQQGDKEKAIALVQPLIDSGDESAEAALVFARLSKYTKKFREAARIIESVLQGNRASVAQRGSLHFELGRTLDSMDEYDAAFEHYHKGVALKCKARRFDMARHIKSIDELIRVYSREFVQNAPRASHGSKRPLFIVGMPRSGTTLVEQILDNHPAVSGAGELFAISGIASSLADVAAPDSPHGVTRLTQEACNGLAQPYLDLLETFSRTASYVTDKMPNNFMHLGLINLLFPQSRIIHCVRDPRDTCLSCYFQEFSWQSHYFSYDLAALGEYYLQYRRIMAHWRAVLDMPMLEVQYEELVNGQESVTRRMIEFCGLDWDPRCLQFQENRRTISTASYDQVRQPLYTRSIGRWRHYERHLGPLLSILERTGA